MTFTRPRVVFLGTPEAGIPSLARLVEIGEVVAVITRSDQPRGRTRTPQPSPVKQAAIDLGLPVVEADRGAEVVAGFPDLVVDAAVVTAFGVLIPSSLLQRPGRGFLNVHFSLLPRWRGAAPVSAAIAAGDEETGVTIMQLDRTLDTGPIVAARAVAIGPEETAGELTERLAVIGADLLAEVLQQEPLASIRQDDRFATYAPSVGSADRIIDLRKPGEVNSRRVRSLSPRPGAVLDLEGDRLGILSVRPTTDALPTGEWRFDGDELQIGSGDQALDLLEVRPAGRKAMTGASWARGIRGTLPKARLAREARD